MLRKMRRQAQDLSPADCAEILEKGSSGVLAVSDGGGYPYAVPLSYVYADGRIIFHSAPEGHKIDALKNCPKASFCVIGTDEVIPEKYTTKYKSVIVFGTARIIADKDEKTSPPAYLEKNTIRATRQVLKRKLKTALTVCLL